MEGKMNLEMSLVLDKEVTFKTVFRYCHIYPVAIETVADGKIDLDKLVTHFYDFNDIQNAMDNNVKAVVQFKH